MFRSANVSSVVDMELSCEERLSAATEEGVEELRSLGSSANEWQVSSQQQQQQPRTAPDDHFMNWEPRVLNNLLLTELTSVPSCDYFHHVQDDLQPFMRKVVTTWMLEVRHHHSSHHDSLKTFQLRRTLYVRMSHTGTPLNFITTNLFQLLCHVCFRNQLFKLRMHVLVTCQKRAM